VGGAPQGAKQRLAEMSAATSDQNSHGASLAVRLPG
jgi:hypothetical protein